MLTLWIGRDISFTEGAKYSIVIDYKEKSLFRFERNVGSVLTVISGLNATSAQKMDLFQSKFFPIYDRCVKSGFIDRLFSVEQIDPLIPSKKLRTLWIEITNSCNQRCLHCYTESSPTVAQRLTLDEVRNLLIQANEFGVGTVQFIGGEPFMHPELWDMVGYATNLPKIENVEIYTNLTTLNKEDYQKAKKYNVRIGSTILGSTEFTHDRCTQSKGSFRRLTKGIEALIHYNIPYRLSCIRMRQNESDISSIIEFVQKNNLKGESLGVGDVRPSGRGGNSEVMPHESTLKGIAVYLRKEFYNLAKNQNTCLFNKLAISSDGTFFPCVFSRNYPLGHINTDTLYDVTKRAEDVWTITKQSVDSCAHCEFRFNCFDCRALSFNHNLGLHGKNPMCPYIPTNGNLETIPLWFKT